MYWVHCTLVALIFDSLDQNGRPCDLWPMFPIFTELSDFGQNCLHSEWLDQNTATTCMLK